MSGTIDKANFIRNKFIPILGAIPEDRERKWGKMNLHQMIEHMSYAFREGSGKIERTIITPKEHIPKMQAFVMSEKPFRENTPNSLLPDEPDAPNNETIKESIEELKKEIEDFFDVFADDPNKKITNPFFGVMGYEQWVQLLYKHCLHHLKQFGEEPTS